MRKLLSLTALTLALTIATAPPAFAQSANAATITKGEGCGGFVPTPSGGIGFVMFTTDAQAVATSAGTQRITCRFDIPEGQAPAKATQASGFGCGTYLGFTNDSKMVATPGGQAILTCHINPSSN